MKTLRISSLLVLTTALILSACGTPPPEEQALPATGTPLPASSTPAAPADTPLPPTPTAVTAEGWSTTSSTRTELSFAFPNEWDGASPLTFGEGEFVKHPELPLGVTFQIELRGSPASLLQAWGSKDVGVVGIATFTPESVSDADNVTIARTETATRIAQGNGITARVAYIQRADDTLEVVWFAPSDQWQALQPVFAEVLAHVEIWRKYSSNSIGLQTMYPHDWLDPQAPWQDTGLWFQSPDKNTGMAVIVMNEIADPATLLDAWDPARLEPIGLTGCSLADGDRMDTMGGQRESKGGECSNTAGEKITYEVSFVPNKDRLLEIITYAPTGTWEQANQVAFGSLLSLLLDIRP